MLVINDLLTETISGLLNHLLLNYLYVYKECFLMKNPYCQESQDAEMIQKQCQ